MPQGRGQNGASKIDQKTGSKRLIYSNPWIKITGTKEDGTTGLRHSRHQ